MGAHAKGDSTGRWIVLFEEAPLASYTGPAAAVDAEQAQLKATSPAATGVRRLDVESHDSRAYLDFLAQRRGQHLQRAEGLLKRPLRPVFEYDVVLNGVALELDEAEAMQLRDIPGVLSVEPEVERYLQTDAGPAWIGAPAFWQRSDLPRSRGEGVVVGVIDSGIRWQHPSFSAAASDGYVHVNPRNRTYGLCNAHPERCNNKLIGIYDMTTEAPREGTDLNGHGTHVAGTVAGNPITVSVNFGDGVARQRLIHGVAPRASIISYKACTNAENASGSSCPSAALLSAINTAVADGVDVINYSIGAPPRDPWAGSQSDALAMLAARAANVVVVVSAGNRGPGKATVGSPANSPWVLSVAATSHDRLLSNLVVDLQGGDTAPPGGGTLIGVGLTPGYGPRDIRTDPAQPLCSTGSDLDFPATGASNPWNGQVFSGEIVVCRRGVQARVAKSNNVRLAGGGGMILYNGPEDGEGIVADQHSIPGTHIGYEAGVQLLSWLSSGTGHRGRLEGVQLRNVPEAADRLAGFSSRGPADFAADALKPDISGPGVAILAASATSNSARLSSGTSMSSPHVAGAAALLRAARPEWGVDAVVAALTTTARPSIRPTSGPGLATPFEQGSGQVMVLDAPEAGLAFPTTQQQYQQANPASGGQLRNLNRPSLVDGACFEQCSLQRRIQGLRQATWRVEFDLPEGAQGTAQPSQDIALAQGELRDIAFSFDLTDPRLPGTWVHGAVRLIPSSPGIPEARLPVSLYAHPGGNTDRITLTAGAESGAVDVQLGGYVAMPEPSFLATEMAPVLERSFSLTQDPTRDNPYDSFGVGTRVELIQFSAGGGPGILDASLNSPTAPDADLFVGIDSNGNGLPDEDEELCRSTSPQSIESCLIEVAQTDPAVNYWILAQNWQSSGASDAFNLRASAVRLNPGPQVLSAIGPGKVAPGQAFTLRLFWDMPELAAGQRRTGYLLPGNIPGREGLLGPVRVDLDRSATHASAARALVPGRSRSLQLNAGGAQERYFIDVPPNASRLSLTSSGSGTVSLYLAHDPVAAGPQVALAPARSAATASAEGAGANKTVSVAGAQLAPGRWYLTPVNTGTGPASITLVANLEYDQPRPNPPPGAWFNPDRSGAGIYVYRVEGAGVWGMVWYTYEADGSPVWYLGASPRPGPQQGVWTVPLDRYSWNGDRARGVPVGEAVLSLVSDGQLRFSWNVLGETGSEAFQHIAQPACAPGPLNVSGLWYSPSRSGFGYSVLVAQSVESYLAYVYDNQGRPRWLLASGAPFGTAGNLELRQYTGFCPLCNYQAPTIQPVGELSRSYVDGRISQIGATASFVAPVAGNWSESAPTTNLANLAGCP